ncbi:MULTISPECIES: TetR/AcrR family transcriptional regulator [Streptomyces]|uniref:AcrR family transcriptional regulator n=2 Tax=Streptomyces TaxID=1883 RepID=A0ABT9KYQ2_9ACTN|nr:MULTISPECIES: TetR/AcrR family transcriptional regulator [Streptomyces]MBW8087526.1 TetR/AcrR family transcriptional regulator [Streptomyces hygroscopicus subsp. hygroscopicus]MCO8304429.1 TetR/AcrR family transcriptional regulator [Streptomyces sp. RKCA744]MDN3053519.1 TetR/AcrR family transcriptional regulator [Streptomyces sp. SRF1]MDP9613578.1 AcrR family transcriptional regulator [Streptomyces demainii]GHJ31439.1 TetR family transcriptional regulator [Streptomyces hygroscopicus]
MAEGLRERKKRQTRQHISDVATGLFMERGFEAVTIAEVAEAAEVSVNTVYNYFPAKEDLFVDREEEIVDRPSRLVRERPAGQSAARALLDRLRQDIRERHPYVGLTEGYDRFRQVIVDSPTLMARLFTIQGRTVHRLGVTLREEAAAEPRDPTPEFIAHQLIGAENAVRRGIQRGLEEGGGVDEVAEDALRMVDVMESLLGDTVLNYAVKNTP